MPPKKAKETNDKKDGKKAPAVRRRKVNGYQMPEPIQIGEILTDSAKQQWKIGPSIGIGGFGEIYSACRANTRDYQFVVKIEPHSNGPLFVEMHFYMRNAKLEDIEKFRKNRGLKTLGMPNFIAHGSHELNNIKHRFLIMPKYGKNIWSFFLENGKRIPLHTIYRLAIQMIDVLEYIHKCGYVHGDLKGANILLGIGKSGQSQAYLVDFGLASHYTTKDFKVDPKKMHNGTIEYTSRDAHNGVPTMRGDIEILAYNLVHWSGCTLPWETNKLLTNPVKVHEAKEMMMNDCDAALKRLYGAVNPCPEPIHNIFKLVKSLKYNQEPDYQKMRKFFIDGLKVLGHTNSGDLDFKLAPVKTKKRTEVLNSNDESDGEPVVARKRNRPTKPTAEEIVQKPTKNKTKIIKPSTSRKCSTSDEDDDDDDCDENSNSGSPITKKIRGQRPTKDPISKLKIIQQDTSEEIVPKNIEVNQISGQGRKKKIAYQINFELDVSIDGNVVVNIPRTKKTDSIDSEKIRKSPRNRK